MKGQSAGFSPGGAVPVVAQGHLRDVTSSSYATFNALEYMKHEGRLTSLCTAEYAVFLEIIARAQARQGNGAVLLEAMHPMGATARDIDLAPECVFGCRFSMAAIHWHPDELDPPT